MSHEIATRKPGEMGMDQVVRDRLVDWATNGARDGASGQILLGEIREMAEGLAGPSPSPIEKTLAQTASLAWFALRLHEAQFFGGASAPGGLALRQSDHHQKRIDRAHRRYLATLKTLQMVRRLATPNVQVTLSQGPATSDVGPSPVGLPGPRLDKSYVRGVGMPSPARAGRPL